MNHINRLLSGTGVHPGEGGLVGLLLIYAFFMGIPSLLTETTAYSLFLTEFEASAIPYIFIGFALVTTFSGFIYTTLERRFSFATFITLNLLLLVISLCLFRLILGLTQAAWPLFALAIWHESSWALANLGFWSLAVHLLTLQQGKRLFALIGTGLTLSESVIGFFVPTLVAWLGTPNLLLVAAASFWGALLIQGYILRTFDYVQTVPPQSGEPAPQQSQSSIVDLLENYYIVLIFALAVFYIMAIYVLGNLFYERLEILYPDADQLAGFLGPFFGATGLLTIAVGAFASGHLINRYGVRFGLLVTPVMMLIGAGLTLGVSLFPEIITLLAWFVILTKFLSEILAYTINRAAWQVLYKPLPDSQRLRAQTVVESMIKPLAGGLVGVILLLFKHFIGFNPLQLAFILFVVLVAWLGVVILLNRAYPQVLLKSLTRQDATDRTGETEKKDVLTILKQNLSNPHPGVVAYVLNQLETIAFESLPSFLKTLLKHPTPEVRIEVLHRLERYQITELLPWVRQMAAADEAAAVRGMALRTLAKLGGVQAYDEVYAYIDAPDPQIRLGAMIGLMRNGKGETIYTPAVTDKLLEMGQAADPAERALAAQVLGEVAGYRSKRLLLNLFQDDKLSVRLAALKAARHLKLAETWPIVIDCLAHLKLRSEAAATLVAAGDEVLPALATAFTQAGQKQEVLRQLPQICTQINSPPAIALLHRHLNFPDDAIRTHILTALTECRYQAEHDEARAIVHAQIKTEVAQATWTSTTLADIEDKSSTALLVKALNTKYSRHYNHLFLLLSFIYDPETMLRVRHTFEADLFETNEQTKQDVANSLEIIDIVVSAELKTILLPLMGNLDPQERLQRLQMMFPQPSLVYSQRLREIIAGSDPPATVWLKACALYTVGQSLMVELTGTVASTLSAPEPLIQETGLWALSKLTTDVDIAIANLNDLIDDSNPTDWLETRFPANHMLLIEKIILLKEIELFTDLSEETLVEISCHMELLAVKSGGKIIEKGEPNRYLYILVDGQVQTQNENKVSTILQVGDILGELSIIDSGPSSNSATAVTASRLLRLNQEIFINILDNHMSISRKFMRHLAQRLRNAEARNASKD